MSAAGGSAAREAARLRARSRPGLWRRLLAELGFGSTRAAGERMAARWDLGARAEQETARMLEQLHAHGWHILHDRHLPGSRANLDHVLISPCGTAAVVLDTKRWHAQKPTWLVRGRVFCGEEDRHGQIEAVVGYAAQVALALGLEGGAVWPLLVVHGSRIAGGRLEVRVGGWPYPVHVLGPEWLVPTLARAPGRVDARRAGELAVRANWLLPPYR